MTTPGGTTRPSAAGRVERIIREFDALPTLGAVAIRLLQLTSDESAEAREVIGLVASDPALSSKVLSLCRCRDRSRAGAVTTVERAVLLLGFEAVRCAVLSAEVFEATDGLVGPGGETARAGSAFDREAFWLHALGVAVASERIAGVARGPGRGVAGGDAFMAGLLHDIGQLVLHVLLPESFDRVCRLAETHGASIDRTCRQIIGIDTHTTGKRLAEHWGLPQALVDVIWLGGQPLAALPDVPHRDLVATVTLADVLVGERYIAPTAHRGGSDDPPALCAAVGVAPADLARIGDDLHDEVAARADALGLNVSSEPGVLLRALTRANASLVRASSGLRRRDRSSQRQAEALSAIRAFHDTLPPGGSGAEVLTEIARSASSLFESPVAAILHEPEAGAGWQAVLFTPDGQAFDERAIEPPPGAVAPDAVLNDLRPGAPVLPLMPWVLDLFAARAAPEALCAVPLASPGAPGHAILLLETGELDDLESLDGVLCSWHAALTAGTQHDSIARLVEEIAESNRTLLETQLALARSQTMATLGEVAAGAAHEMNNPLMIISGRSQLLARRLTDTEARTMATEIDAQAPPAERHDHRTPLVRRAARGLDATGGGDRPRPRDGPGTGPALGRRTGDRHRVLGRSPDTPARPRPHRRSAPRAARERRPGERRGSYRGPGSNDGSR